MRRGKLWKRLALLAAAMIISRKLEEQGVKLSGTILGVPYDFYPLTLKKIRSRVWNPEDPRIFTPHVFGIGWSVNIYQVMRRMAPQCPLRRAIVETD
jgi:hypothetical protein